MRSHLKHLGHVGFAQPHRDPEAPAGTLRAPATRRTRAAARRPISGPAVGAAGRSAARASAEQRLGSSSKLEKAAAASPGSGAPGPDPLVLETHPGSGVSAPRALANPEEPPGNDEPGGPGGHRYSKLLPTPDPTPRAPLHYYIVTIFQAARIVIFNAGKGASCAHV